MPPLTGRTITCWIDASREYGAREVEAGADGGGGGDVAHGHGRGALADVAVTELARVVEAAAVDCHIQHVEDLAGTPGPAAGSSTIPPLPMRATPPRCTTYQTPRHEIMDAIPNERTCPSTSYTSRELGSS